MTSSTSSSTTSTLTINTKDTANNVLTGYYTVLYQNGNVVATGFSPAAFTLGNGQTYVVQVDDYGSCHFDHWQDTGSTNSQRPVSITTNTQMMAIYDCGSATGATVNVSTTNSVGGPITGFYTSLWQNGVQLRSCFSPCSFSVSNGQTYQVAVADYGAETFSHWSDGTTNRFHPVVVGSASTATSLTAVYMP
jgi:hypothetical protein